MWVTSPQITPMTFDSGGIFISGRDGEELGLKTMKNSSYFPTTWRNRTCHLATDMGEDGESKWLPGSCCWFAWTSDSIGCAGEKVQGRWREWGGAP